MNGKNRKEGKRNRLNMIGGILLAIGVLLLVIKGLSPEYLDDENFLHEYFFLVPLGFGCIFAGVLSFVVSGVRALINKSKNKEQ